MADDRGTDYVNQRGREMAERQEPKVTLVMEELSKINIYLPGCGFDKDVLEYLQHKMLDVFVHLELRKRLLQERLALDDA